MVGYYNYSVYLTYGGLVSAIIGITRAMERDIKGALICLLVCGLCDLFDGTIASHCKRTEDEKSFGMHIDSLCDMVSFGVFPALIAWGLGIRSWYGMAAMCFFVLCAVIRLAFFDVQEINILKSGAPRRDGFLGLPVTNVSLIIPGLFAIDAMIPGSRSAWYSLVLFLLGVAFITPFKMKKAYGKHLIWVAAIGVTIWVLVFVFGDKIECLPLSMVP